MSQWFLNNKKERNLPHWLHINTEMLKKIPLVEKKSGELGKGKGHPIYVCYIIEIDFLITESAAASIEV